jgi:hypothetical protein
LIVMTNTPTQSAVSGSTYQISDDESLSDGVIQAVARVSDAEPIPDPADGAAPGDALEPLYTVVDPDALDALFDPTEAASPAAAQVRFQYHGYVVTVRSDGRIQVEDVDS